MTRHQLFFSPRSRKLGRAKAKTTARGYGTAHQRLRKELAPKVAAGLCSCARCGERIEPGQAWDLDHSEDRRTYLGPSHATCNRATSGRRKARRRKQSQVW